MKGSMGGAFPRRTRDDTGGHPLSMEALSEVSDGLDRRRRATSFFSREISSSFSTRLPSISASCSQFSLHRSLVFAFCFSSSASSWTISALSDATTSGFNSSSSSSDRLEWTESSGSSGSGGSISRNTPDSSCKHLLIQLAGHLKGRAIQEWNLIADEEKRTYSQATGALRGRLDPGSRIMAAQDFRHASQEDHEKVGDFIRHLEQLFKLAYGRDPISGETRTTLLYGQLQEGLEHQIMESPAVSGATDYQSLCLAAKTEEKRLAEIQKRCQYHSEHKYKNTSSSRQDSSNSRSPSNP